MAEGQDWRETLPEDLRGEAMFKDIPDVPTLAKVARDLKAYQGRSIQVPADDADEKARDEFKAKLLGIAPSIAEAVEFKKAETARQAAAREASEAATAALKKEWGSDYDSKVQAAKVAAMKMGVPEGAVASMPPSQVKVWAQAAANLVGNGHQVGSQGSGSPPKMTPSEAKAELEKLRDDPKYYDGRHPEMHKRALELTAYLQAG